MTQSQKSALIVGASRGLGLGLVETFLARGWRVTATQRTPSPQLGRLSAEALRIETADIDDDAGVAALHDRLAGQRFDLIFVVAGVATQAHDPLHAVPRSVAAQVFLTNAVSPVRFAEAFLDRLAPGGSLALMSSVLGSVSLNDSGGWETYRASKAALNQVIRGAAIELARTHREAVVAALHPGTVETPFTAAYAPSHGKLAPEEAARRLLGVLDRLTPEETGRFWDHEGREVPW